MNNEWASAEVAQKALEIVCERWERDTGLGLAVDVRREAEHDARLILGLDDSRMATDPMIPSDEELHRLKERAEERWDLSGWHREIVWLVDAVLGYRRRLGTRAGALRREGDGQ